jgi:pumilio family protein 6
VANSRKSREDQKTLLKERKMQRPNAPLIQKAKSIWEKLRLKKITKEEREKLMDKMMTVITGKCQEVR